MAWHAAALYRAQTLPSLADLVGGSARERKPQSWQEMRNNALVMTQLMGGTVRQRLPAAE